MVKGTVLNFTQPQQWQPTMRASFRALTRSQCPILFNRLNRCSPSNIPSQEEATRPGQHFHQQRASMPRKKERKAIPDAFKWRFSPSYSRSLNRHLCNYDQVHHTKKLLTGQHLSVNLGLQLQHGSPSSGPSVKGLGLQEDDLDEGIDEEDGMTESGGSTEVPPALAAMV